MLTTRSSRAMASQIAVTSSSADTVALANSSAPACFMRSVTAGMPSSGSKLQLSCVSADEKNAQPPTWIKPQLHAWSTKRPLGMHARLAEASACRAHAVTAPRPLAMGWSEYGSRLR